MLIISLLFALLFVILGLVFLRGKGVWLIAGYNTASPAMKARVDEKQLTRFMSKLMFAFAVCSIIIGLSDVFKAMALVWVGFGLMLASAIGGVIYINVSKRFVK